MTDFIVVRHGETDWNRQQRFQGHIDVPLNATGLQHASRRIQELVRMLGGGGAQARAMAASLLSPSD